MRTRSALIAAAVGIALLATACSSGVSTSAGATSPGAAKATATATATATVQIEMVDIAFAPKAIDVKRGDTVKFVFTNNGQIVHDAVVGDAAEQTHHEKAMRADAAGMHGEGAVTVKPGKSGEITHTFDKAGTFEIGCHQAGHYGAGMKITANVT